MNKAVLKGWYTGLVSLALLFSTVQINAQNCPTVKRNNGNNAAHTVYATSIINTAYNTVPTSSKEGTITVDFGYAIPSSIVPVIEGVYIGGVRQNVDFGPPSEVNKVGPKYNVEYCFYGNNLAPAHTFTVKFLDPSDGSLWSECTFPSLGAEVDPIAVSTDITDNSVCSGESITWSVLATKQSSSNSLRYQWYTGGVAISGETNSSLTVSSFSSSDAGTYYCVVEEYRNSNVAWSHQTESGTLSLADCSVLQLTRIQSPEEISISSSNDLTVAFDVEFNQSVSVSTSDFEAYLDETYSRTISSVTAYSGSTKRFTVVVDITDQDEGDLALNVKTSNAIVSTVGSLTLSSTTPTITNNNTFDIGADGVSSSVESAVAGGDRNGDGVPDRNQKNVSTFPWRTKSNFNQGANAASGDFVTLSIGDVTNGTSKNLDKNLKISSLGVLETTDSYFDGISFPTSASIGGTSQNVSAVYDPIFFKIEANGNSFAARDMDNSRAGTQIRLYFDMPDGGQNFNSYMKWNGVDGQWYEFVADGNLNTYDDGAEFIDLDGDGDYDRIVLTITEGSKTGGDADGSADDIIIDPGTIVSTAGLNYTGALSFEVLEGTTPVTTLSTTGATTWAITPVTGYDHSLFSINSSTGALSFSSAPDFENPQDAYGTANDNIHMVRVTISDGSGNSTVIDVEVTVINQWEKDTEGCPSLTNVSPSTGAGTLFDRYAGNYTQQASLPGGYTGYFLFTFPTSVSEYGVPFIDKIFADGVEITTGRFDNPRIDDSGNKAFASTGIVQFPYYGGPSDNIWSQATISVFFTDGTAYDSRSDLCTYLMNSPYNSVTLLDVTENFTSSQSVCGGSGAISVTVNNATTATTGPNSGTLQYQWQQDLSGTWTDISGATSASYAITGASQNGVYRCIVREVISGTDYYDVYYSNSTSVTVVAAPTISASTLSLCVGGSGTLTGTTTNHTGETWITSDATVATVTSTGVGTASVTGVAAGTATITYTDGNGCTITSSVTIESTPSAALSDATPSICASTSTYALDLTSVAGAPDSYRIDYASLTDISATAFTGTSLTIAAPTSTAGTYTGNLYLKNSTTTCESAAIPFTITIDAIPSATLAVSDATICTGSSATITVTSSESGYSYQLRDDSDDSNVGSAVTGTGGDITFSVSPTATTSYNVYVTNGNCAVELTDKSTVTIDAASVGGTLYENGTSNTSVTVTAGSNTTVIALSGHTGSVIQWESSSDNTFSSPTVIANTATTYSSSNVNTTTYYRALIQNGSCISTYSSTFTVSTNAIPTFTLSSNSEAQCPGSVGSLTISTKSTGADQYRIDWDATAESVGFSDVSLTAIPGTNILPLAANTTAGTYNANVYVKNSTSGLESSAQAITFTVNAIPSVVVTSSSNVTCFGSANGSINITTSGTGPLSYSWSNGSSVVSTNEDLSGLTPDSYTVTVTDANSCTATASVTITEPTALSATISSTNATGNGVSDGSATVTASGGTSPYTYSWNTTPAQTGATATGLAAGSYTVTVTDANNCTTTQTVVITQPAQLTATGSVTNEVSCNGGTDGSASVSVAGGVSPYTYSWSDGTSVISTASTASTLSAGSYTVTVTDANSNTATASVTVTEPTALSASITGTNVGCNGASTGSADLIVSGGTPGSGYTYSWSDGTSAVATTEDLINVAAGSYTVTVTDANSCTTTASVTITQPSALIIATTATDVSCTGNLDGTLDATVSGGTTPYTFSWTNGASIEDQTGVGEGSYTLTVTDANGCSVNSTVIVGVTDNTPPVAVSQDITVNLDASGSVTITTADVDNGSSDNCTFTLSLDKTSFDCTNLGANTVTLTATDGSGNTHSVTATVTVEDNIDPTITAPAAVTVNVDAGTCATALTNVTLGTPTIADNCSATASNNAPASFPLGSTTVTWTATDGSGNTATATQVVTVVDNIAPVITAPADVTVNVDAGVCSTALSNVTLGAATTSDNCSVASVTNDAPSSFPLGNTTVTWTVTDGAGNTTTATQVVTVIDNIDPTITCPSDITAYADATTNGTAVTWSPAVASDNCTVVSLTSDIASGSTFTLGATTVTYTATDQSGNFVTCTFTVTVLDTVSPVITNCPADITQDNDAGNCSAVVTWTAPTFFDNSGSYTTVWSHNSGDVFAVGTTTVTATVTDAAGNSTVCSFDVTVEDNEAPVITAPADVTVNADAGSCDALVSGVTLGTPTVSDNCGVASTANNTGTSFVLGTNTVTWTVTDIHGNSTTATQTVTVLDAEDPVVVCPSDFTAYGAADSTMTSVSWTAATATDNCSIDTIYSDVQIGAYLPLGSTVVTYVAIDGSGNTDTCSFTITVVDTVSPVITNCPGDITQSNDLDSCGAVVNWTAPTYYDNSDYYTVSASHSSGDYFPVGTTTVTITVADSSGNTSVCEFDVTVVDNQAPYVIPFNSVAVTLGADGMYTLAVNDVDSASYDNCGITAKYLSKSFFNCNDVPSASTWLVVEDIHGNKDSSLVTVQVALNATPVLSVVETLGDVLCYGDATGNASIAVSGGVSPYVYNWSNGSTTAQAVGLSLGSYWYEVTDTNGCYTTDTVFIDQPDALNVTSVKSLYTGGYNVSIYGTSDGAITTTVTGGLTPYTFDWNSGAYNTQNLVNVPAGIYTLVLLDSNNCSFTLTDTLTEPTELLVEASALQYVVCPDDTIGTAIAVPSGAVPPYTYSWDFGATTDYVTGLSYGIYTVTVTDTNGATASDTVLVDALDYDCDGIYNIDEGGTPGGGGGDGDLDGDGIPNYEDEDSDGDGLPDSEEFDYDNDGVGFDDCDGDGIPNFLDPDLCDLLIPAVFTPNGDGDNDTWEILGIHAYPDNVVQVFNRWGELVYYKEGYDNEFNGRANTRTQMNGGDGLLPIGTYYYVVKIYETGDIYSGYVYITK